MAQTLNVLDLGHFCANELGSQPQVTFRNLRIDPELNLFALAESITIRIADEEYSVPFLLPQGGSETFWEEELRHPLNGGVGFVFAGDAGALAEAMHKHDWRSDTLAVAAALWCHYVSEENMALWDMIEPDDGTAYSLKYGEIARHIEALAFEKFDKDRLAQQLQYRARWDALDAMLDWLEKVNSQRKHWCSGMTAEQLQVLDFSATTLRTLAMRLRDDVDHDARLLALPLFNDWRLRQFEDDLT
ncbi:MAG: hypothetical protein HC853_03065, partial [Anaerolineae bacterium]|nr:hypothetical protein [Anaerolineae bacterium]